MEKRKTIFEHLDRAADYVRSLDYYPIFISLHGSQNYGLDIHTEEYQSDYDYKCVVLPNLRTLVENSKPVSMVYDFEGGHIDVKDIRIFIDTVLKMNPSYLECFFTPYAIRYGDEGKVFEDIIAQIAPLLKERGLLFAKACYGMFMEKEKAMCHPYPTLVHKIEKWGYDGKQVHHMYRLLVMLREFESAGTMVLHPPEEEVQLLLDLKLNRYSLEQAKEMVEKWKDELNAIRGRLEEQYKIVKSDAANAVVKIARRAMYDYCCSENGRK